VADDPLLAAARRVAARSSALDVGYDSVAREAGIDVGLVKQRFATRQSLVAAAMADAFCVPVADIARSNANAQTGEQALQGFVEALHRGYTSDFGAFQSFFLDQVHAGTGNQGLSGSDMQVMVEACEKVFGPTAETVATTWDTTDLDVDPRRLVFVGWLAVMGLVAINGLMGQTSDAPRHSDDDVIKELGRALSAPTASMLQLRRLNEASATLNTLRSERDIVERVPSLMCEALGFSDASLQLGVTTTSRHEGSIQVPVCCGDEVVGMITATGDRIERREAAGAEMFAHVVGLALDNVRFYERMMADKMTALSQLVAGLCHELNTPLGALGSAQQSLTRLSERVQGLTGAVEQSASGITETVARLKRFAQLDRAGTRRVDIHQCIDDGVTAAAAIGVSVSRSFGHVPTLVCTPADLNQLFLSVIRNAADAGAREISIATVVDGDDIVITIADDGDGMHSDALRCAFDPGFTTKSGGVGCGLGLAICHRIVGAHGGRITLDSDGTSGTTAQIRLPVSRSEECERREERVSTTQAPVHEAGPTRGLC
jgi:signal transduction histidine kinase